MVDLLDLAGGQPTKGDRMILLNVHGNSLRLTRILYEAEKLIEEMSEEYECEGGYLIVVHVPTSGLLMLSGLRRIIDLEKFKSMECGFDLDPLLECEAQLMLFSELKPDSVSGALRVGDLVFGFVGFEYAAINEVFVIRLCRVLEVISSEQYEALKDIREILRTIDSTLSLAVS